MIFFKLIFHAEKSLREVPCWWMRGLENSRDGEGGKKEAENSRDGGGEKNPSRQPHAWNSRERQSCQTAPFTLKKNQKTE